MGRNHFLMPLSAVKIRSPATITLPSRQSPKIILRNGPVTEHPILAEILQDPCPRLYEPKRFSRDDHMTIMLALLAHYGPLTSARASLLTLGRVRCSESGKALRKLLSDGLVTATGPKSRYTYSLPLSAPKQIDGAVCAPDAQKVAQHV